MINYTSLKILKIYFNDAVLTQFRISNFNINRENYDNL